MAAIISTFVIGEIRLPNLRKQTLIRMAINADCVLSKDELDYTQDNECDSLCLCAETWLKSNEGSELKPVSKYWRIQMSPLLFSCLVFELRRSRNFRINVIDKIRKRIAQKDFNRFVSTCHTTGYQHFHIKIVVSWGGPFQLDKTWNSHLDSLIHERIELDEMLACLSTLGGAFSSLGDQHLRCAETAGKIALRQMQLATKLGEVTLIAKCKLFMALSLMQRGNIKGAKRIIREQYALAKALPDRQKDNRLENMCKGAWAKLQYINRLRLDGANGEPVTVNE